MLTIIGLISTAFGVSVASALLPLISVELFVVGLVLEGPHIPWWALALVIAIGQMGGKTLYYYAAQGIIKLPRFLHRKTKKERTGRWRTWLDGFRDSCQHRPVWTGVVLLVSAVASLPPYAATAIVAGWARIPLATFLITGFVGRFTRFAALAVAPTLVASWL